MDARPAELAPEARAEESATDRIVEKTPWWALSTGIHVVLALICAFMVVLGKPATESEIVSVKPSDRKVPLPEFDPAPVKTESPVDITKPAPEQAYIRQDDQPPETMDDMPERTARGVSEDMLTKSPFNNKHTNDAIGAKGGPSGRKGRPNWGGRAEHGPMGSKKGRPLTPTNDAVLAALRWLARHQNENGSWGVQSHLQRCGRIAGDCKPNASTALAGYDDGATGLSLLAFLGAGYSHLSKDTHDGIVFGDVVRRGLQYLMTRQDASGGIGINGHQSMYNHSVATLALVEAYGLTGSTLFHDNAQRAVDFLVAAQNPGKGWRYEPNCGRNDTSVTGWAVMALKSAELADLRVPRGSYDGVRAWLDEVTESSYHRTGYDRLGTGKVYCEHNQSFNHHESLTAIAMMSRIFIEKNERDTRVRGGAELLMRDLPKWSGADIDYYYWYYASLALFQLEDGKGERWERWNKALTEALLKNQNGAATGCKSGSWEPADRWSCEGGRVYATAINALTLEVYYRYASVFTGTRR